MFRLTAGLLSRRRISVLAATVALGTSGVMLGAGPASAAETSAQGSSGLLGQTTTVYVPATTGPTSSDMPGVDTGIDLAPGEAATVTATGTASCLAAEPDASCDLGANGSVPAPDISPPFMAPGIPAYSLDGEVGGGQLTFIGTGPGHGTGTRRAATGLQRRDRRLLRQWRRLHRHDRDLLAVRPADPRPAALLPPGLTRIRANTEQACPILPGSSRQDGLAWCSLVANAARSRLVSALVNVLRRGQAPRATGQGP
jgi:hypothetical protein